VEVPLILASRRHLDASSDWSEAVADLVATWRRDRAAGPDVFLAPAAAAAAAAAAADWFGGGSRFALYFRNRALSVSHAVSVSPASTGLELYTDVAAALDLRENVSVLDGLLTAQITSELRHQDQPLLDKPLVELGLGDGVTVDMLANFEVMGDGGSLEGLTLRGDMAPLHPNISPRAERALLRQAFGHLMPSARSPL
jgi:hypothetical protein